MDLSAFQGGVRARPAAVAALGMVAALMTVSATGAATAPAASAGTGGATGAATAPVAHAAKLPAATAKVAVRAFKIPTRPYRGVAITPALSTGASQTRRVKVTVTTKQKSRRTRWVTKEIASTREWAVVAGRLSADLVSVSTSGKVKLLSSSLLPPAATPAGQTDALPAYGSVEADGHVWLLGYSLNPAPLYAVGFHGHVVQVASLPGDFTDLVAGPGNRLEAADASGAIERCRITDRPSARCTRVLAPATFAQGQVAALGQTAGRVWFTDDSGELGSFNPANGRFGGPYGDLDQRGQEAGEASADPGTIAAAPDGSLYVAGGQESDPLFQNDLIRLIDPHNGRRLRSYSVGLTNVVALTSGPDGDIWFLNETNSQTGGARVGVLNVHGGAIRQYALPKGYRLPPTDPTISPGPVGSGTLFFTLETISGAHAALGEVSGISAA